MVFMLITGIIIQGSDIKRRHQIAYGLIVVGISNIVIGPDPYLQPIFTSHKFIVMIAMLTLGIGYAMILVPIVPEIISILSETHPNMCSKRVGRLSSTFKTAAWSFGEFLGPLCGGFACEMFSFERSISFLGIL